MVKRSRGQRRRIKRLLSRIGEIEAYKDTDGRYEHFPVPSDPFISSPKTSGRIKTSFCRAWLAKTAEIAAQKPDGLAFCRVVACIAENDLWASQIIIFYDEEYYNAFWERNTPDQTWLLLPTDARSFSAERNINTPLREKGYREISKDGEERRSTLWFYGDV